MSRLRTPTPPPRPVFCLGYKSQCLVLAVMCHTNKIFMMHQDNSPSGFLFCCAGTSRCQAGYSYGVLQQTFTRCYGLHYRCLFRHPVQPTRYILFWPVSGHPGHPVYSGQFLPWRTGPWSGPSIQSGLGTGLLTAPEHEEEISGPLVART